jgi:hypothetical protein
MASSVRKSSESTARRPKNRQTDKTGHVPLLHIQPSPENDELYRPVDSADPEIAELANSIRQHGLLEPLILTADNFIVSGHRRFVACKLAGLRLVPCRRLAVRREDNLDKFVLLLREHNRQRDKTQAEKLREEVVNIDPESAYEDLLEHRAQQAWVETKPIDVGGYRARSVISEAKLPLLNAVRAILAERRKFWPLDTRQIHYSLLNNPPLIHANKPDSVYCNDLRSYKRLVDLLTRARLEGLIQFEAIGDETRPVAVWHVQTCVRSFCREELDGLFTGYWRDRMQSQTNHYEIVGEKNTLLSTLRPVAAEYTLPLTIGRGFCSLPPRRAIAERYRASGKVQLVLLILSDFDPDGEGIAESFARSMRDDLYIDNIHPIKVALTAEQVEEYELPPIMKAKQTSSRSKSFVEKHGDDVFELEALSPDTLQQILRDTIDSVIDREAYDAEVEAEKEDAAFLKRASGRVLSALRNVDFDDA